MREFIKLLLTVEKMPIKDCSVEMNVVGLRDNCAQFLIECAASNLTLKTYLAKGDTLINAVLSRNTSFRNCARGDILVNATARRRVRFRSVERCNILINTTSNTSSWPLRTNNRHN